MSDKNKHSDNSKDLLLEDYKYLRESFWKSEETGETRVKFFITLVTAVFAGLLGFIELKINHNSGGATKFIDLLNDQFLFYITLFSLFLLLVFGIVTLFRILKRNKASDEYKRGMDKIHQRFKDYYDGDAILEGYYPLGGKLQCFKKHEKKTEEENDLTNNTKKDDIKIRKFGGLAHSVAALNSVIFAAVMSVGLAQGGAESCLTKAKTTMASLQRRQEI